VQLVEVGAGLVEGADEGTEVGAGVAVGNGSNIICPNADNNVFVVVSVTSIESVPAVVEVAVNIALPDESRVADEVANARVESVELDS
jgi:hypothetical protein